MTPKRDPCAAWDMSLNSRHLHRRRGAILRSAVPWSPTGGTFAPNGDLWLLEATVTNQVRVRRIASGVRQRELP